MLENLKLGFIILLTGIVVVFAVLILLICIIKLYSTLVYNAQNKNDKKGKSKEKIEEKIAEAKPEPELTAAEEPELSDGSVPGEIIAAIAAAVEVIFGEGAVKIKSVKKSSKRRSAWKSAGVAENTRSF